MNNKGESKDTYGASLIRNSDFADSVAAPSFTFNVECFDKNGNLKWKESFHNTVVTAGLNKLLSVCFDADTQITTWYLGLKGTGTVVAGDTLASHAGWAEETPYAGNRPSITFGTAAAGSLAASSAVSYSCNATATVAGAFICSAASGTTGTLYSAGNFTQGDKAVDNGDTLNVTPTVAVTAA